jgi:hypothetical protein
MRTTVSGLGRRGPIASGACLGLSCAVAFEHPIGPDLADIGLGVTVLGHPVTIGRSSASWVRSASFSWPAPSGPSDVKSTSGSRM